ncbi:MAG: F0F1 ATP synthase subunit A [Chloroflexota bacterium]
MGSPQTQATKPRRRFGFHRWLILALIILNVVAVRAYAPIQPHIQAAAEVVAGPFAVPVLGELHLTNTMIATFIAVVLLALMGLSYSRAVRRGTPVLRGLAGLLDTVLEALFNLTESVAGKRARQVFPWVATIILLVLVVNWMEIIPGVDSIGWLHEVHGEADGYPAQELFRTGDLSVSAIVKESAPRAEGHGALYGVIPFVRAASTDLNFTLGLALVAVTLTEVMGVRANGLRYFKKFFNFGPALKMWTREHLGAFDVLFPFIDIFVGLLELVAELARLISFSFRLFGVIFAGSVVLFLIGSLVPVFVQSGFVGLELFFGLIQAMVFGMLTLIFVTLATQSHDQHGEGQPATH